MKAAPTLVPQLLISLRRLTQRLTDVGLSGVWHLEQGRIVRLGRARQVFLSAASGANVVGATAHLLLEVDEAQDVSQEKFYKEFRPMGAASNVTTVLYGTPWNDTSLLEEMKQLNLELERRDGVRRHFRFDWQEVARYNPSYAAYVEGERQRLGEDHPLFRTQYALLPLTEGGGLLSPSQQAQLQGSHLRCPRPEPEGVYVAGIDVAGEAEEPLDPTQGGATSRRDATVVTIGELDFSQCDQVFQEPAVRVVEHYWWVGQRHTDLYLRLVDLLRQVWRCRRVVVDATGVGEGMASFLARALGRSSVVPFKFTAPSKSRLGFDLLAAVNGGRLKMYAPDGSPEFQEFWRQVSLCRGEFRPNRTLSFFVDATRGHDDFIVSLALLVHATSYLQRTARGRVATEERS